MDQKPTALEKPDALENATARAEAMAAFVFNLPLSSVYFLIPSMEIIGGCPGVLGGGRGIPDNPSAGMSKVAFVRLDFHQYQADTRPAISPKPAKTTEIFICDAYFLRLYGLWLVGLSETPSEEAFP